jgi:hypothetical protein
MADMLFLCGRVRVALVQTLRPWRVFPPCTPQAVLENDPIGQIAAAKVTSSPAVTPSSTSSNRA